MSRLITIATDSARVAGRAHRRLAAVFLALAVLPQVAFADLPTVTQPTQGGGGSGLLGTLQGYFAVAVILAGLLLAAGAFIVVASSSVGKFREAQKRGEWGDFGMVVIVGVALVLIVIWLASKSADIL